MGNLTALLYAGLVVIVLPLLVLGTGVAVWARRRHL
jgi:thiosulfate reductase cytochrome b subunit